MQKKDTHTFKDLEKFVFHDAFFRWAKYGSDDSDFDLEAFKAGYPGEEDKIELVLSLIRKTRITPDKEVFTESYKMDLLKKITDKGRDKKAARRKRIHWAAACVALLVLGLSGLWMLTRESQSGKQDELIALFADSISMGEDIQIIINENEAISIDKNNANIEVEKDGSVLVDDVLIGSMTQEKEAKTNQIIVPYGKRSNIKLPDGSTLWMNSGTRVVYRSDFAKNRRLYAEGEVFLEVRKDKRNPFTVKTSRIEVEVLGTSFNVSDYKDCAASTVTLVTGSIHIQAGKSKTRLSPNQQLNYEGGRVKVQKVEVAPYICWKDDIINFDNMRLKNVLKTLSRYYHIPIEGIEQLEDVVCYGNMDINMSIEEVLESMTHTISFTFRREGDKILVFTTDGD